CKSNISEKIWGLQGSRVPLYSAAAASRNRSISRARQHIRHKILRCGFPKSDTVQSLHCVSSENSWRTVCRLHREKFPPGRHARCNPGEICACEWGAESADENPGRFWKRKRDADEDDWEAGRNRTENERQRANDRAGRDDPGLPAKLA